MDKNVSIVAQDNESVIALSDNDIRVMSKKDMHINNPVGVVTILPGVQIKLGRSMEEFIGWLKLIRRPLAVQNIADGRVQSTWNIIRMATGNVSEAIICTFTVLDDTIAAVTFNQSLLYDEEFKKYQRLSALHLITAGKCESTNKLSKAVLAVSEITGQSTDKFKIASTENKIAVTTNIENLKYQYTYTFVKDKNGYFNLLSVSIAIKKMQ